MNRENVASPDMLNRPPRQHTSGGEHSLIGRRYRVYFYYLYTAFTLGAATAILIPQSQSGRGSNFIFSVAWIFMHAISCLVFIGFRKHRASHLAIALAIGAYILASAAWSSSPFDTLVYGGMVAGNIATAYMISRDLSLREIMLMSVRVILTLAILGMLAGVAGFSQALYFDGSGRRTIIGTHPIRGFFNHKIPAALFATLGALASLSCYKAPKMSLAILGLAIFVLLTGSSTGLAIFPTSLLLFWVLTQIRRVRGEVAARATAITGVIGAILAVGILSAYMDVILAWLGRDPTLTGRTLLWEWGIKTWSQSPIVGWGFNGYFNGPDATAISSEIKRFENYDVPHFHQSYIQTAVDLGAVGILILLAVQASVMGRAWKLMRGIDPAIGVSILTMMIVMVIASTTMFIFVTYNHYATFIMFTFYFALRSQFGSTAAYSHQHQG